eukprot:scaffold103850_cov28-Tisochrysis_lutea.AAC.5
MKERRSAQTSGASWAAIGRARVGDECKASSRTCVHMCQPIHVNLRQDVHATVECSTATGRAPMAKCGDTRATTDELSSSGHKDHSLVSSPAKD